MAFKLKSTSGGKYVFEDERGSLIQQEAPQVGKLYQFGDPTGRGGYEPGYYTIDPDTGKLVNIGNATQYKGKQLTGGRVIPTGLKEAFKPLFASEQDYQGIDINRSAGFMQASGEGEQPIRGRIDSQQGQQTSLPMAQAGTLTPQTGMVSVQYTNPKTGQTTMNQVPTSDLSYWVQQGWEPAQNMTATTTPVAPIDYNFQPKQYTYGQDVLDKKANDAAVRTLYEVYFNRQPTQAELNNWGEKGGPDTTVKALENFLQNERGKYGAPEPKPIEGEEMTSEQRIAINNLNAEIDSMQDYTLEQKAILKQIASMDFTSGQKIPTGDELSRIIATAATNAETDLAPYYERTREWGLEDVRNKFSDIRNEAARYAQQESKNYNETLATTKQSLRARGMTFSGLPKAQLGTEGFTQTDMEGSLQQKRRYDWEDALAGWQQNARDLGTTSERYFGSTGLEDYGKLPSPYTTTQGKLGTTYNRQATIPTYLPKQQDATGYIAPGQSELDLERQKAKEEAKWRNISSYRAYI